MSRRASRRLWAVAAVTLLGTMLQLIPSGCSRYLAYTSLAGLDFCSIINCEGGTFFDPCRPVRLFVDCPTTTVTQQQ